MFGTVSLLLSFAQPALAADHAELATVSVVGYADAAGKKKKAENHPAPAAEPAKRAAPSSPQPQAARPSQLGPTARAVPRSRPIDTESHRPARPADATSPDRRSPAPEGASERSSSHEASGHESADRSWARESAGSEHSSERHASADHGSKRHESADRASSGHHQAAAPVRHAPAYSRAAERHRAATHAYASHHAAWVSHHGPSVWYRPWRAGHPVYWYHGVFVYGPPAVYVGGGSVATRGNGDGGGHSAEPKRSVSREGKFSLGFTGGSYLSGFHDGTGYGDAGLGITAAYRPIEPLAFQLSWSYHDASWSEGSARIQQPLQLSAELFAFPWSRVSPYVLAGVTMTDRNLDQPFTAGPKLETDQSLWGPHGGVGIEFALGKSVALDFDARFIGYVNKPADDPSSAGALQANMGLNFYF